MTGPGLFAAAALPVAPAKAPVYALMAVDWRTGDVAEDNLPLTGVSAQLHVKGGRLSASLPLGPYAEPKGTPDRFRRCRELLAATTPDLMTVMVVRDKVIMGEWLIWTRSRTNGPDPVTIGAVEVRSWWEHIAVDGFTARTNVDQLTLVRDLARHALARPPGISCTVAEPGLSGNIVDEADYPTGTDFVGKIMDELGDGVNGFDWWVDTAWDTSSPTLRVKRTLRIAWPRRGQPLEAIIDIPLSTPSQSGVQLKLDEDGTKVAPMVYMTGTGEGDTQLVSRGINADLIEWYPALNKIDSRSSQSSQTLLDAQSAAVAAASRTADLPTTVTLKAVGDLQLGTYAPGDTLPVEMEGCANFPDGYNGRVRILGYTIKPPADGTTEMVDVEISRDDASVFDS